jgi:hypothetical protein
MDVSAIRSPSVKAHVTHDDGDTSCLNTRIIAVEGVELPA